MAHGGLGVDLVKTKHQLSALCVILCDHDRAAAAVFAAIAILTRQYGTTALYCCGTGVWRSFCATFTAVECTDPEAVFAVQAVSS
jgi:hypothetical protein